MSSISFIPAAGFFRKGLLEMRTTTPPNPVANTTKLIEFRHQVGGCSSKTERLPATKGDRCICADKHGAANPSECRE
jgi:hypothetical protein